MKLYVLLVMRSLRLRPLRMLLSGFGVVLGVGAILAIGITDRTALDSVTQLFADSAGKSNLVVRSADSAGGGFGERVLTKLARDPSVALAAPSLNIPTMLADQAGSGDVAINFFGLGAGGLLLQGIDPELDPRVRSYTLAAGRMFEEPDADEVVLVKEFADTNDLQIGKGVDVVLPSGITNLRLVGLLAKEGPARQNNGAFGVLPLLTAQKLADRRGKLDQVDLLVRKESTDSASLERVRKQLQADLGEDLSVTYPATQGQRMTQMLSNYQIGLNFLSGMALFVGAFLVFNAFSMTVVERTREFGMLRTVGMSRGQVIRLVLSEALLLGLVSSVLGLIFGLVLAGGLGRMMGVMLALDLGAVRNIPGEIVMTGLFVGVAVSLFAATLPAVRASNVSPLEALRVRSQTREGWVMRYGWIVGTLMLVVATVILVLNPFPYDVQFRLGSVVTFCLFLGAALIIPASLRMWERLLRPVLRLLFGRSGQLGSINVHRSRLRTTLTTGALMVGVAMIVVVWVLTDSFRRDVDEWLKGFVGGDIYITSSLPMRQNVWRRLDSVAGVEAATPVRYFEAKWQAPNDQRESILFMGFDPGSYGQVADFVFDGAESSPQAALARLAAGGAVFVSTVMSERYGLQSGDRVTLYTKEGPHTFNVAAVVVDYYNQGMVIKGSWQDMRRYFREDDANTFLVKVQPGVDPTAVAQQIDDLYGKRHRLVVTTNRALMGRISSLEQQAFTLFDMLALITMLVGFFGITNTLTMNVLERRRELGMLRAVGMSQEQILRMVLAEAALMGLVGAVMGLVLGAVLARIFMLAMTTMSGYRLAWVFPLEKVVLALLIGILTALVAALLPALRATRIRILEAIRYE